MATERDAPYSESGSPSRIYAKSPGDRSGVSLREAIAEWSVHHTKLYELEAAGRLIGIHVGNRVWYSRAQLTELLGAPKHGPSTDPAKLSASDNGRKPSGFQLDIPLAALTDYLRP
jgi:hypothetical protein